MISWVEGKGLTVCQLRAYIRKLERENGQPQLISMLKTILEIRESN